MLELLVYALRGAAAVGVIVMLVGGLPRVVGLGLAAVVGLWSSAMAGGGGVDLIVAARELVIGATIGVIAVVPLLAAAMAGRLVDVGGNAKGVFRGLFGFLAAAVFVGIDGHVHVLSAIVESFRDVPAALATTTQPRVLDALGALVGAAVRLAVPWLVTASVVEIAIGIGMRVAGRAGATGTPAAAGGPAALAMMTAALVGTLAVAFAALVR